MMKWLSQLGRRKYKRPATASLAELQDAFPYQLAALPPQEALEAYFALRQESEASGYSPFLFSDLVCVEQLSEGLQPPLLSPPETLERAATIDIVQWLAKRQFEEQDLVSQDMGQWPDAVGSNNEFAFQFAPSTRRQRLRESVYMAMVPTRHSWEIPAYLNFGGWNSCPEPELQVAIAKYWHDRYGADMVATDASTLEFFVAHPPQDREAAESLALEQYLFCYDIVVQGVMSIRNLAGTLQHGTVWYFWWD